MKLKATSGIMLTLLLMTMLTLTFNIQPGKAAGTSLQVIPKRSVAVDFISIYTDKYTYSAGDTMHVGLNITNPFDVEIHVCVAIWLEKPIGPIVLLLHAHNLTLPAGFTYSNPSFESFVLPNMTHGVYTWHAALLNPTTHSIIVEDTAEWQFVTPVIYYKIGALLPLTGDLATYGENSMVAMDLAAAEVNAFLQLAGVGWTLKLVVEDTGTDPVVALAKLESLHAEGIELIIGPMSSDEVSYIKAYADANKILVISQSSTRPGLNQPDDFLFRFCPTDLIQGPATARLMTDDNITHVIAVYRNDAWGKGIHDATKARFVELGGTFVKSLSYDPGAPAFPELAATLNTEVTSAIATYGADKVGVLYIGFEEVVVFFTEVSVYSADGWGVKWYGSDGTVLSADMIADVTTAAFSYQTGFINPIFSPTRSDKWQKVHDYVYATLGRSPDTYAYIAYDIVWVYALSLLAVDKYDSEAVRAVVPTVTENYFGASGWIVLDAAGDRASADYDLWIIDLVDTTYEWKCVGKYVQATDSVVWY